MCPRPFLCSMIVGIVSVLLLVSTRAAVAQAPVPTTPPAQADATGKPAVDPKAEQVMRKMTDYYKGVDSAQCVVETHMKMEGAGRPVQEMHSTADLAIERPNKLAVRVEEQRMGGGTVVSDGKKLNMYLPMMKKYAEQDAPKTMDELLESPVVAVAQYANIVLVLFADKPYDKIMEDVNKVAYVGQEDLDGKKHDHLRFEQGDVDLDVWIDASDKPLVRRVKPDMSRQIAKAAEQMPQMKDMKMDGTVDVKSWKIGQAIPDDKFAFTPPADATKVDSIAAIFGGGPGGGEDEVHALQDKPAPDFSLDLLGGGKASLAEHKGKNVVVLDFWATWCPPCVKGLPIVTEVAKNYADKGVVFYAVNEQEDAATIEPFLKQHKLDIKVALDKDGAVGNAYGVTGIPQTVIIDKQGVVKVVHVGLSPNLKDELTKEIEALLSGTANAKAAQSSAK